MSLRAIKKRESQAQQQTLAHKPTLFKKSLTSPRKGFASNSTAASTSSSSSFQATTLSSVHSLEQQRLLLGRATRSNPDVRKFSDTLEWLAAKNARLVRTKSEADVTALLKTFSGNVSNSTEARLLGAKSEVCLQTISVHNTAGYSGILPTHPLTTTAAASATAIGLQSTPARQMLSGARSHRDLTQSSYGSAIDHTHESPPASALPTRRRMSECSFNSAYSQRTSALSTSALTLSQDGGSRTESGTPVDLTTAAVRVPIIGYEVMEERARFTVYKLRVENPYSNDCWLVLRRYTDFVRLNTKLKQAFPHITLMLPRKKIFGDNFNAVFLDNRVQGLQLFVNSIMAKEELRKCKLVREFFCLDEPPTYSESMEECRAIFEAQEETIAHLKLQINSKNDLILNLQQKLRDELTEKEMLKEALKNLSLTCANCSSPANGSVGLK